MFRAITRTAASANDAALVIGILTAMAVPYFAWVSGRRVRRHWNAFELAVQEEPRGGATDTTMDLEVVDHAVAVLVERIECFRDAVPAMASDRIARFTGQKMQPALTESVADLVEVRGQRGGIGRHPAVRVRAAPSRAPSARSTEQEMQVKVGVSRSV